MTTISPAHACYRAANGGAIDSDALTKAGDICCASKRQQDALAHAKKILQAVASGQSSHINSYDAETWLKIYAEDVA